jgi:hypothetical protein
MVLGMRLHLCWAPDGTPRTAFLAPADQAEMSRSACCRSRSGVEGRKRRLVDLLHHMDAENGPVDVLLAELALRQHGAVARRQLERLGISRLAPPQRDTRHRHRGGVAEKVI